MNNSLNSKLWAEAMEKVRVCHLSLLQSDTPEANKWVDAFNRVILAVRDERKSNPYFAPEFAELDEATGVSYSFKDIFEEYFDLIEKEERWNDVIVSADEMIKTFAWKKNRPSEYMYRKGTALEKSGRYDEAVDFGEKWLQSDPSDLYAAASYVFLLIEMGNLSGAKAITEKYMASDLVCSDAQDTFFMAAYRLYEMTEDSNAKKRVEERMAAAEKLFNK